MSIMQQLHTETIKAMTQPAKHLGIVTSAMAALFTVLFCLFLVLDNKMVYFTTCLLLSLSVLMMVISMRTFIPLERRVLIDCAVAFSILYAMMVGMVYYTQISVVLKGTLDDRQLMIVSDEPGTVFFYLDMFGYCFLCMATLFMAFAIEKKYRFLKVFLMINGCIVIPTFLLPFMPITYGPDNVFGVLILVVWGIIFTPLCGLLTKYFLHQGVSK